MQYLRIEKIGSATLYLADGYQLAPQLGIMDCMVTDPPYAFKTSGGGHMRKARKCLEQIRENGLDAGFDFSILNPLLYRSVFVFCHNDQLPELLTYLKGSFARFCVMQWHKTNPMPVANKHYLPDTEFIIHAWNKGGHPDGELKDKNRYIVSPGGRSEFDHPTVKPLPVMEKLIGNANGGRVIDPFMGTGTTGIAALDAGKEFIGIEKNEAYFEIACQRIEEAVHGA